MGGRVRERETMDKKREGGKEKEKLSSCVYTGQARPSSVSRGVGIDGAASTDSPLLLLFRLSVFSQ